MIHFLRLVQNEWMKLFAKKSTWMMTIVLLVAVFTMGGLMKWDSINREEDTFSWEQRAQQELNRYESIRNNGDASSTEYKRATEKINILQKRLEDNLPPLERGTFWWFVNQSNLMFPFITLFIIIIASAILSTEFSRGTIKLLVIRPISRAKLLYSKYVSVLFMLFLFVICLFIFSLLAGVIYFPYEPYTFLSYENGQVVTMPAVLEVWQLYLYKMVHVVVMATIAFMIATLFRSNALAIGVTMFLTFTGGTAMVLLRHYEWTKYLLFSHINFEQHLTRTPLFDVSPFFSIVILVSYMVMFHVLMYISFTKRDIAV